MCKNNETIKISFIGDIMCEKPLLKAAKKKNGLYDFDDVFINMKSLFKESDYLVGNLETVCAGEEKKYTDHIYNFNSPDSFIEAVAKSGIHMVTTANNHCLDRGISGLKRTISILDKYKLEHIGTYTSPKDREKTFVKDFNGLKVSFLNYTYGTNVNVNGEILNEDEKHCVNLLKSQRHDIESMMKKEADKSFKARLLRGLFKIISVEQWIKLKKVLGLTYNRAYRDDDIHLDDEYLDTIKRDIKKAKKNSDYVVVCLHSGGQFNREPGKFTKYIMRFLASNGVNLVLGTHPHVVQRHEKIGDMLAVYSIGNFNISPSSVYLIDDNLPDFGLMFHLYLKKQRNEVNVEKYSFSILKMHEDPSGYVKTYPVDEYINQLSSEEEKVKLKNNVNEIYNRFTMKNVEEVSIQKEYDLPL